MQTKTHYPKTQIRKGISDGIGVTNSAETRYGNSGSVAYCEKVF